MDQRKILQKCNEKSQKKFDVLYSVIYNKGMLNEPSVKDNQTTVKTTERLSMPEMEKDYKGYD